MGSKLLGGAAGICQAVAGLTRHLLWYLSYQVEGSAAAREERGSDRRR